MDLFEDFLTFCRGRAAWNKGPELIAAVFFLGTAFFTLLIAGIENFLRKK